MNSPMIDYPLRPLQGYLVTGGGAPILVAAERAKDFPQSRPTSSAPAKASRPRRSTRWRILPPRVAFLGPGYKAFAEAGSKWPLNTNGGGLSRMHSGMVWEDADGKVWVSYNTFRILRTTADPRRAAGHTTEGADGQGFSCLST
jgi:hypothetical protein